MKNFSLLLMLLLCAGLASAQGRGFDEDDPAYERVRAQRVAYITQRLNLTPEESRDFWPLHNAYENQKREIGRRYRHRGDVEELSETEARELITRELEKEEALLKLRQRYFREFLEVLPARKLVLYGKADREFKRDILRELKRRRGGGDRD